MKNRCYTRRDEKEAEEEEEEEKGGEGEEVMRDLELFSLVLHISEPRIKQIVTVQD